AADSSGSQVSSALPAGVGADGRRESCRPGGRASGGLGGPAGRGVLVPGVGVRGVMDDPPAMTARLPISGTPERGRTGVDGPSRARQRRRPERTGQATTAAATIRSAVTSQSSGVMPVPPRRATVR
ncbi:hypothetical protein, partial [Micromonospora sp. KC606]|uniref:hypothetical protein n=1 Tax=Micromonospora sp. KC606 TaxID=2530379 RepID=UPI001A9D07BC